MTSTSTPNESTLIDWPYAQVDLTRALPTYASYHTALTDLLNALASHPSTPRSTLPQRQIKATRTRPHFVWDFVGRTRAKLCTIDPALPESKRSEWGEAWLEVVGRSVWAVLLCTQDDEKTYAMCMGDRTPMTAEVLEDAGRLEALAK